MTLSFALWEHMPRRLAELLAFRSPEIPFLLFFSGHRKRHGSKVSSMYLGPCAICSAPL